LKWYLRFIILLCVLVSVLLPINPDYANAESVHLKVPFIPQVPPGHWGYKSNIDHGTYNCGQTSALMVMSYYKVELPVSDKIAEIDNWLAQKYNDPKYSDHNSWYTDTDQLAVLAKEYGGFKEARAENNWNIDKLKTELINGCPVIVAVHIRMNSSSGGHFMVLTGIDDDYVYVNDPGLTKGIDNKYPISQFKRSWAVQNNAVVTIHEKKNIAITFLFDTTHSVNEKEIEAAKRNAISVVKELAFFKPYVAAADYRDVVEEGKQNSLYGIEGDYPFKPRLCFTQDLRLAESTINSIAIGPAGSGGNKEAESVCSALKRGVSGNELGSWPIGSEQNVIIYGNAGGHIESKPDSNDGKEPVTGYYRSDVVREAFRRGVSNRTIIFGVATSNQFGVVDEFSRYSRLTGGFASLLNETSDYTPELVAKRVAKEIENRKNLACENVEVRLPSKLIDLTSFENSFEVDLGLPSSISRAEVDDLSIRLNFGIPQCKVMPGGNNQTLRLWFENERARKYLKNGAQEIKVYGFSVDKEENIRYFLGSANAEVIHSK